MMGMGFGFGGFGMIIFWIAILAGAVYLFKYLISQNKPHGEVPSPIDILKKRYALGEISKDEYDRLKSDLMRV